MKVIATNLAQPTTILLNGKNVQTGIYKRPTQEGITLGKYTVDDDMIADRKHHGGIHQACYLFSKKRYPFWKEVYPKLAWEYGMFGENLTVDDMDEDVLMVGSVYELGSAIIQITIPRMPCSKLAYKFGGPKILKQFINDERPGTYVRVIKEGRVRPGDMLILKDIPETSLSVAQLFGLMAGTIQDAKLIAVVQECPGIPEKNKAKLLRKYNGASS